ncbi:MAG: DUF3848 domain-containing protein [Ruminococcus sp.]|nr:DUF3848 domain-containing protein [Ruminococcus sp.]
MKTTFTIETTSANFDSDINDRFQDFFGRVIADIKCDLASDTIGVCGQYELETAEMLRDAFRNCKVIEQSETESNELKNKEARAIHKVDPSEFNMKLEGGDIERCFAFNVFNKEITLLADIEKGGENDSISRVETMRFTIPKDWNDKLVLNSSVDVRGQYAGGITAENYENRADAVNDFMHKYNGLVVRHYVATDNLKLSALTDLPPGIAYVYFQSNNENFSLSDVIKRNHFDFEEEMKTYSGKIVYDSAYEIVTKNEIAAYIENTQLDLTEEQHKTLLSSNNPLDEIYQTFLNNDHLRSYEDIDEAIQLTVSDMQESIARTDNVIDDFMSDSNASLDLTEQSKKIKR